MDDLDKRIFSWIILGVYYGYPECCIEVFSKRAGLIVKTGINVPLSDDQKAVLDDSGFVPCNDCARKLIEEGTFPDTLINRRICNKPYPENGSQEEIDKHFITMGFTEKEK